jgi:hypothetical protein
MTLDAVAAVTNKIYDIKVTENKGPEIGTFPYGG